MGMWEVNAQLKHLSGQSTTQTAGCWCFALSGLGVP